MGRLGKPPAPPEDSFSGERSRLGCTGRRPRRPGRVFGEAPNIARARACAPLTLKQKPAGGLGQLDSSRNGPIPQIVVRGVSPHLDPLPQGEEIARLAQWRADRSGLLAAERMAHPLPKG